MKPKLYTIGCPKCNVLEKKLIAKGIEFERISEIDSDFFISRGIENMPVLEVEDGVLLDFKDAVDWINKTE